VGDALIHPMFVEWVRYLRSFPVIDEIFLTTNGILLDRFGIDEVLESGVTRIIVSTAGFEEEMYRRVFRSDAYQRMRRNTVALLERNARREHPVDIRIALRPDRPLPEVMGQADFQEILAYRPEITFHWSFGSAGGRLLEQRLPPAFQIGDKRAARECCEYLFRGPIVLSDGTVLACCCSPAGMDFIDELSIGNILDSSLLEMWTGPKMGDLRARFEAGTTGAPCRGCGQYEGLDRFRTSGGRRAAARHLERYRSRAGEIETSSTAH
jgi:MoaA/NifB/PqqE/SkfB family radical SAM enzyme